jgi:hypothetical protein
MQRRMHTTVALRKRRLLGKEVGLMRHFTVSECVHLRFMLSGSALVPRRGRGLIVVIEIDEVFQIICAKLHVRSRMIGQASSQIFLWRRGAA